MSIHRQFRARLSLAVLQTIITCTGCVGSAEVSSIEDQLRTAGLPDQLALRVHGDPLDDGDADGALDVAQVIERVLATSPEVQAALARISAARADAQQARLLPNPIINVAVRFPEGGGGSIVEAGLSADVLAVLLRPRRVGAADSRLRGAIADAMTTVLDVLAEAQETYAAAQALDAEMAVIGERRRTVQRLLDLARARVAAGESGQLDVITLDADRAALDVDAAERAAELRRERLALARLIGQPSGTAEWTLPPWSAAPLTLADETALVAAALEQRPEVQARRWELAALGDDAGAARWAVLDDSSVGADAEREDDWSVGPAVAAPLPLLDWGQARRRKAQAQLVEARHRLTQARRQVVQEVRQAAAALIATHAALAKVGDELIPLQDRRLEQAEAAYRNGLADVTAVLLAEQQAQATRTRLIELQRKTASARVQLERAVGGPGIVAGLTPATTSE